MEGLRDFAEWLFEFGYNLVHNIDARDEATKARDADRAAKQKAKIAHHFVAPRAVPVDRQKVFADEVYARQQRARRTALWDGVDPSLR
jgi:hypothetical protein